MEIYIQSAIHIDKRFLIFRTVNGDNTTDEIVELKNKEISEELIDKINSFISVLNEDNIKLYITNKLVSNKGEIKAKWSKTKEAKEFNRLIYNMNIEVHNFKEFTTLKDELVRIIIDYSKAKRKPTIIIYGKEYKLFNSEYKGTYNQINLYLRGIANYADKNNIGFSVAVLNKGMINKELYFTDNQTTSNRMLLIACIRAVKALKEPCAINIYTHTNLGFSGGNVNSDLKQELFTLLKDGNHCVNECVSRHNQEYLMKLIKNKFKQ